MYMWSCTVSINAQETQVHCSPGVNQVKRVGRETKSKSKTPWTAKSEGVCHHWRRRMG